MKAYDLILKRRSIRKFLQKAVGLDLLDKCVDAARMGPSAVNLQPLDFITITEDLDKIFECTRWAGFIPDGAPKEGERPVAYIAIISDKARSVYCTVDSGIAAQNIVLTALEEGVASCLLAALDREKLDAVLKIPSHLHIEMLVALGYPMQKSVSEVQKKDAFKYYLDSENVVHVPKRPLKDVVHREQI
ncbi:MAG: nitroreductase family protein [archaeon]